MESQQIIIISSEGFGAILTAIFSIIFIYRSTTYKSNAFQIRLYKHQAFTNLFCGIWTLLCDIYLGTIEKHINAHLKAAGDFFSVNLSVATTTHIAFFIYLKSVHDSKVFENNYRMIQSFTYILVLGMALPLIWNISGFLYVNLLFLPLNLIAILYCFIKVYYFIADINLPLRKENFIKLIMVIIFIWGPCSLFSFDYPKESINIKRGSWQTFLFVLFVIQNFVTNSVGMVNYFIYKRALVDPNSRLIHQVVENQIVGSLNSDMTRDENVKPRRKDTDGQHEIIDEAMSYERYHTVYTAPDDSKTTSLLSSSHD